MPCGHLCNKAYSTKKIYDDRQRLIQEINPLGEVKRFDYNEFNLKIAEEVIGSGKKTTFNYDKANRLFKKEIHFQEGSTDTFLYKYNELNQLISEVDSYQNETDYSYDRLGRVIQITYPSMKDLEGTVFRPIKTKKYNLLDQMIEETDENGHTTQYAYTITGKPYLITYPDKSVERSVYYPFGLLKQKWFPDGSSLHYKYNAKGYLINEASLDKNGVKLKEQSLTYKGPLLISKNDSMGLVTTYKYNGIGLLICETVGGEKVTKFSYDDFGRLIEKTFLLDEENGQVESYEYDGLDREVSKTHKDLKGKIYSQEKYEYDIQGHLTKKIAIQSKEKASVHLSNYHSDGSLQSKIDPLNKTWTYSYEKNFKNAFAQTVLRKKRVDALNRTYFDEEDAFHRLISQESFEGPQRYSLITYDYDGVGHLKKKHTVVMVNCQPIRDYDIIWKYNSRGLVEFEVELPSNKSTQFLYDTAGRLKQRIKPDGIKVNYEYDSLGLLKRLFSSDRSIDYTFEYNLHDNPIVIKDAIRNLTQVRKYDLYDQLKEEEIYPGIIIKYAYDKLGRLLKMCLPNGSGVYRFLCK